MEIEELDVVVLQDGKRATVRDIYSDAGTPVYHVSLSSEDPKDWVYATTSDIREVVWRTRDHRGGTNAQRRAPCASTIVTRSTPSVSRVGTS